MPEPEVPGPPPGDPEPPASRQPRPVTPVSSLRRQIGHRHREKSEDSRWLARWSSGAAVATWAFANVGGHQDGHGLFASLNQDARDSLTCLARVPAVLPLITAVAALYLVTASFITAARVTVAGKDSNRKSFPVAAAIRPLGLRWLRWLVVGWWLCAALAGGLIVAVSGALLRSEWSGWLVWTLIAISTWLILKAEDLATTRRYRTPDLPTPGEVNERMAQWRLQRPSDTSGMPWLYGYSGLTEDEIGGAFFRSSLSGPMRFATHVMGLVIIVLFYSALPVPSVQRFASDGVIGCLFVNLHSFAGVAAKNFVLFAATALVLFAALPLFSFHGYFTFMMAHRMPTTARREVLLREKEFMLAYQPFLLLAMGVPIGLVVALLLWLSAVVAITLDSPLAGAVVLTLPFTIVYVFMTRRLRLMR